MTRFDPLAIDAPILGKHLLEASAGTGKTFSIEHIFIRLLLESSLDLEEILVVTFTRASTRELTKRIKAALEEAIRFLETRNSPWEYLTLWEEKAVEAKLRLKMALQCFERGQIFTIHGFCYRMLKEFSFEANVSFSMKDPEKIGSPKKLKKEALEFLEKKIDPKRLSPEQLSLLLKKYRSLEALANFLIRSEKERPTPFSSLHDRFIQLIKKVPYKPDEEKALLDYLALEQNYKKAGKKKDPLPQIKALIQALHDPENPLFFRRLLKEKGNVFSFLSKENEKVKTKPVALFYPGLFEALSFLAPLIREGSDESSICKTLAFLWHEKKEERFPDEWFHPDEIIRKMQEALSRPLFVDKVQEKYRALIIDEFQDTDPFQWQIFQTLFLGRLEKGLKALYFVGDPKQSIYRFRKADIYTYIEAKKLLGEKSLYSLDTNFRSSKELVEALNALFEGFFFSLPKKGEKILYAPVRSGRDLPMDFQDGKGAVHAIVVEGKGDFFEEGLLPYAALEIERLSQEGYTPSSFAILVKDRYQAEKALSLLQKRDIPAFAKSHTPIGRSETFKAIEELFYAAFFPNDLSYARALEVGPFAEFPIPDLETLEKGLVPFFQKLQIEKIDFLDPFDLKQIVEELLFWEAKEGFSKEGLFDFLEEFKKLGIEEGGRRRGEARKEAVQILTLHISKGLEFDIVFALGVASLPPDPEEEKEEYEAEKERQLYVALTRAKKRVYFPALLERREKGRSPIDCLIEKKKGPLLTFFEELKNKVSFTYEKLPLPYPIFWENQGEKGEKKERKRGEKKSPFFFPQYIHSFTTLSLVKQRESLEPLSSSLYTEHTIPRGKETGVFLHGIFEKIFSSPDPIWKDREKLERLIKEELFFTPFLPWEGAIFQMVDKALSTPLIGSFTLSCLNPQDVLAEMEFLFLERPHFVKGFIDLIFFYEGKYYLIDWKTNWLGKEEASYSNEAIDLAIKSHHYELQASIYAEALTRHLGQEAPLFGGAIYFFIRGGRFVHFMPEKVPFFGRENG